MTFEILLTMDFQNVKFNSKTMKKKLFIIAILSVICAGSMLAGEPDYVITKEGVTFFKKVKHNLNGGFTGIDESGKTKLCYSDVLVYKKDGRIYEKMPLVSGNKITDRELFMELMAYRNGLKIYGHKDYLSTGNVVNRFFVYRDKQFVLRVDDRNKESLASFFRIQGTLASL